MGTEERCMPWYSIHSTCSAVPVVASFRTSSLGIPPSVPWNAMSTAAMCSCNASETGAFLPSPSGMTCARCDLTTPIRGLFSSRSRSMQGNSPSAADSPAPASPLPAKAADFQTLAQHYGQSSPVSLGKYDHATHSLRTAQHCLFEDSTAFLQ